MSSILRRLRPFAPAIALCIALIFGQTMADLYLPTLMADVVNKGIATNSIDAIIRFGIIMLVVACASMVASVSAGFLSSRVALGFGSALRSEVFRRVESFSLREIDRFGISTLITRNTNDVTQVQMLVIMGMRMMIGAPLMCIGGIIMAVSINARLSLVLVAALPILVVAISFIAGRGSRLFRRLQEKVDVLNRIMRESLSGVRVIRAFNRIGTDKARFDGANRDLTETALKAQRTMTSLMPIMMVVMNFTTIAIVWFGGHAIEARAMGVGDLMAFLQYAMMILFSFMMVSMMFVFLPRAAVSAGRIAEVLETRPGISDPASPKEPSSGLRGVLEFRNVGFRYPGAEERALSGVSFMALPGEVTAVIGGTGSGKSTLVNLVPRFYDPEEGAVLVDGVDVREMSQASLRLRIGYAPQKAVLFSDSVAGNIGYGSGGAEPEEIRRAGRIAQATDFIETMAGSWAAAVSQGGANLSGGQKQRLSIARALARKPEIYLFDDSFSALDFKTEAALRSALKEETEGATVIIVAQRVSSVKNADRIVVLEDGAVAGIGTHRELLETCPVYREIALSQLSEEEIA
jgi:ATP-binding cassette subfamily B multidrug efflux pump